jgi:two-component system sensor histidine kinase DesK
VDHNGVVRADLAADVVRTDAGSLRPSEPGASPSESAGRIAAVAFAALLFFPVRDLFDSHPSTLRLGLVLSGVGAFFVVYLWRFVFVTVTPHPTRSMWWWLAVACALVVALVVGDSAHRWAPLFIFVSAIIGVRVGLPWAAWGVAVCTVLPVAVLAPIGPLGDALAVAAQALAVGALTAGMGRLRATIAELQDAREQLAQLAVTEERLRFARDLHDLLGHSLSVIALKAELAGRLLPAQADRAAKEVADIDAVARGALVEVRQAVSGYRQPTLAEAVAAGRLAMESAAIETSWDIAQVSLPHDVDVVLGWAVREAITNVIRHSRARQCSVVVSAGLVEAAAEVIDDGVGAPGGEAPGALASATERKHPGGNGLAGLSERVSALHGRLDAGPRREGGFRLRASIPMTPAQPRVAT